MEFYEVLERRRTMRDMSDREVSEDKLERIIGAAFKAPTNDHLRQFEFVVVRDVKRIAELTAPLAGNIAKFTSENVDALAATMDKDEYAMFVHAMPRQQRMLCASKCLVLPFFRQLGCPLLEPGWQSGLNYFASVWAAIENMLLAATAEGLVTAFHVPIEDEAEYVKRKVNAPAGYELPCFLAIGYPADGAHVCVQKEIDAKTRIHENSF